MYAAQPSVIVKALDFGSLQVLGQDVQASPKVCLALSIEQSLPGTSLLCHFPDSQYVSSSTPENTSWHLGFSHFHRKLMAKSPQEMAGNAPCPQKHRTKEDYAYVDYNRTAFLHFTNLLPSPVPGLQHLEFRQHRALLTVRRRRRHIQLSRGEPHRNLGTARW